MPKVNATGMSLEDLLRPREVGVPVVSHVLENATEPTPDFDAMQLAISMPIVKITHVAAKNGENERTVSQND